MRRACLTTRQREGGLEMIPKKDLPFIGFIVFAFALLILAGYWVAGSYDTPLAEPLIRSLANSAKSSLFWWKVWLVIGEFIYIIGNVFAEEVIFRGPLILLRQLVIRLKIPPFVPLAIAAVFLSAIYSLLHLRDTFLAHVVIFGLGLILSAIVGKTGKLMPAVLAHIAWNFTVYLYPALY